MQWRYIPSARGREEGYLLNPNTENTVTQTLYIKAKLLGNRVHSVLTDRD